MLHRLTSRTGSATATWSYTPNSPVVTATQPGVATVTTYPSLLGPPDSVKTVLNGYTYWQRYRYTSAGLDSVFFTGSQDASHLTARRYLYNANSGVLELIRLAGSATGLGYDATLANTSVDLPGSATVTRTLGSFHAPLTSTTEAATNEELERWIGFNRLGQIDRQLRWVGKIGRWFSYDSLGQLRAARNRNRTPEAGLPQGCPDFDYGMSGSCTPNVDYVTLDSVAYTYDAVGNRTDQGGSYATGNRIAAFAGCTYQTDAAGNVVSRKGTSPCVQMDTLLWTAEGWLDSLEMGSTGIKFLYDADGRLTVKRVSGTVVSWFLWDGPNLLAELNGAASAVVTEYSYYGMDAPHAVIKQPAGTKLYARMDGLGNVKALTNDSSVIRVRYGYSDWGKTSSTDDEGFNGTDRARWKGALWLGPELDIYYMRNRWYEPYTGRFLSEDPIGLAGGINPGTFAGNDPVNGADPLGLWCSWSYSYGMGMTITCTPTSGERADALAASMTFGFWDYFNRSADARWRAGNSVVGTKQQPGGGTSAAGSAPPRSPEPEGPSCGSQVVVLVASGLIDAATLAGIGVGLRMALVGGVRLFAGRFVADRARVAVAVTVAERQALALEAQALGRSGLLEMGAGTGVAVANYGMFSSVVNGLVTNSSVIPGKSTVNAWRDLQSCRAG